MSQSDICKVCGRQLAVHHLVLRWGVAHAAVYVDGRSRSCSEIAGDYSDFRGQINVLTTLRRSLRWRAGRLRSAGATYHDYDLDWWANKITVDITRLQRLIVEHYPWTKET